jgi:hypothetical protein
MANKAAIAHFQHVAAGNARTLKQRELEYDALSPFERLALGLTLHRQQVELKGAMLGASCEPAPRTAPFSIKELHDAATRSSDS